MDNQPPVKFEEVPPTGRLSLAAVQPQPRPRPQTLPLKKDQNKLICPLHSTHYRLKCEYIDCKHPYICPNPECLDRHFHTEVVSMSRFDSQQFMVAFEKAYGVKEKVEKYFGKAMQVRSMLDSMKASFSELMTDMKTMNGLCEFLQDTLDHTLSKAFLGTLDNVFSTEQKIVTALQSLKARIVIPEQGSDSQVQVRNGREDPCTKQELHSFLEAYVPGLNWDKPPIFSGMLKPSNIEAFHRQLASKDHLVFMIVTENSVYGAYYPAPYPSLTSSTLRDTSSFIFASEVGTSGSFTRFLANPKASEHLTVDQRLCLCLGSTGGDGLRMSPSGQQIHFCLPTESFVAEKSGQELSGSEKIVEVRVLQGGNQLD